MPGFQAYASHEIWPDANHAYPARGAAGPDGSLRGAAADMGIAAITLEIGDPQKFHIQYVRDSLSKALAPRCKCSLAPGNV